MFFSECVHIDWKTWVYTQSQKKCMVESCVSFWEDGWTFCDLFQILMINYNPAGGNWSWPWVTGEINEFMVRFFWDWVYIQDNVNCRNMYPGYCLSSINRTQIFRGSKGGRILFRYAKGGGPEKIGDRPPRRPPIQVINDSSLKGTTRGLSGIFLPLVMNPLCPLKYYDRSTTSPWSLKGNITLHVHWLMVCHGQYNTLLWGEPSRGLRNVLDPWMSP